MPWQPLAVPAEMVASADRLDGGDVIAGTAQLPGATALIRTSPDGRRRLQVSTWDGTTWQADDVGPGVPGEPQNALLAGNEDVAAIGGWTWEAGMIRPYLLTSTDRTNWAPVRLPESVHTSAVTHIALDGGRLVALVQGAQRSAATVLVEGAGDPTVTPVPVPPDGDRRTLSGMAIAGDTVMLTGRQGPTSGGPLLAFRSADAGRTWSEPVTISSNERAEAWGVAHLPTGFVVTGHDLVPADGDFADGERSSAISEVCLDPTGRAIAVGWIRLTAGATTATIWTEQDGRWQRSTLPTGPDASSSFSSCSTIGERLVISGVLEGDTERWTVGPAGTLEPTGPPEVDAPSEARGDAHEPYGMNDIGTGSGWYFATGRLDTAAYTGRVIWLSADGTRWTWVPFSTAEPDASLMAAADGDDLILLSSSTNVAQAWRIRDVPSVIAARPAG